MIRSKVYPLYARNEIYSPGRNPKDFIYKNISISYKIYSFWDLDITLPFRDPVIEKDKLRKERKKMDSALKNYKKEFKLILGKANIIYNSEDQTKDSQIKSKIKSLHRLLERIVQSDRRFIDHIFRPKIELIMDMITK